MHDIFYFTDVHGQLNLFTHMRDWCKKQDPECTIIFGGDAADRGEYGYEIIKQLLYDPQIIYLYGNHEDLFIKAADAIIGHYADSDENYAYLHNPENATDILDKTRENYDVMLHIYNGGESTLRAWLADGANEEIIDKLRDLPRTFVYGNIDFCHAGGNYYSFKAVNEAERDGNRNYKWVDENIVIWDRNGIPLGWETGRICVHGHTPTMHLPGRVYEKDKDQRPLAANIHPHPVSWGELMGAPKKRGGKKIDMDTGMTWTGFGYVLNILTMYVYGFYDSAVSSKSCELDSLTEGFANYKIL